MTHLLHLLERALLRASRKAICLADDIRWGRSLQRVARGTISKKRDQTASLFNLLEKGLLWASNRVACFADGHRWQVVSQDFTFCQQCDKTMQADKAERYFASWMAE